MSESYCKVDADGVKWWRFNHELHREDGPAVEYPDGRKYWYLNGKLHREDGHSTAGLDGTKCWYLNGNRYSRKDYYKELIKRGIMTYENAVLEML